MRDPLAAETLMDHVRALADGIGPRPPGHPEEAAARAYIRQELAALGYDQVEEQPFRTPDEPAYAFAYPLYLGLAGALIGELGGRAGKLLGGAAGLAAAGSLLAWCGGRRQPLTALAPQHPSANLIVRIAPTGPVRRRAVLLGHTDTQRAYPIFRPAFKRQLVASYSQAIAYLAGGGLALLARFAGLRWAAPLGWGCTVMQLLFARQVKPGSALPYVAGANDNATAVACLLGIAAALRAAPLRETELWLAFTGAEEVMGQGLHQLLDAYGHELRDAAFIDFEMVGSDEIVYVTRHSGLSYLSAYRPDAESLGLALRTAIANPDLAVRGRDLVIAEEIGTLRRRGFRGLCVAGVGPDGWLEHWHLPSDMSDNIKPGGLERAARFGLALLRRIDQRR
jgi:acetylornithine deacetylase/succinyl-diaminopimelate desuccinylase-like protein